MKNSILSELFTQMANIMEILGEDRFRINTYRKVGRIIGDMPTDIETMLATGELTTIPGVGKSSIAKIEEYVKTGTITAHNAKSKACSTNVDIVNSQIETYFVQESEYPSDLSVITTDINYFPDGPPTCPLGGTYSLNSQNRAVCNHSNGGCGE